MISNINYRGKFQESVDQFKFNCGKPRQYVVKCPNCTLVIFQTGNCRIMGCKTEINFKKLPYKIQNLGIQSVTVTDNLHRSVHLYKLKEKLGIEAMFEPELFPGLRYEKYNPLCVNVFASGKIVILGLKTIKFHNIVEEIKSNLIKAIIGC